MIIAGYMAAKNEQPVILSAVVHVKRIDALGVFMGVYELDQYKKYNKNNPLG